MVCDNANAVPPYRVRGHFSLEKRLNTFCHCFKKRRLVRVYLQQPIPHMFCVVEEGDHVLPRWLLGTRKPDVT